MTSKLADIYKYFTSKFLKREFITFVIIGFINTGIHMIIYIIFREEISASVLVSNTFAFIFASTFSYFANSKFTFKNKHYTVKLFVLSFTVFTIRLVFSNGLTILIDYIFIQLLLEKWRNLAPLLASIILIPFFYLVLGKVLKPKELK